MTSLTQRGVVVLWEPQDPINVGAAARACMLTDIGELRVVNPGFDDFERVHISAPNGDAYIADHLRVVDSWEAATEGVQKAIAFTARGRHERQGRGRLEPVVDDLAAAPVPFALVFGREDHGLPNAIVDRCDLYVCLESSARYRSFNLAQAVMIAVHRVFVASDAAVEMKEPGREFPRPSHAEVERMMGTAEEALDAIDFFKGDQRENVLRTIRRVVVRAEVDTQELATLWAIFAKTRRAGRLLREAEARVDGAGDER